MSRLWTGRSTLLCGLLCLVAVFPGRVDGQGTSGVVGDVADSSGGAMVGVKVRLTEQNTGIKYEAKTDSSGGFLFPSLPVGIYQVQADFAGFRSYEQKDVLLQVGERQSLRIEMQPGQASESVTVSSAATLVDTANGELGTVVDE